jgi:hypothetical protein
MSYKCTYFPQLPVHFIDELWSLVHKTQMVHPMENPQILAQLLSPSTHVIIFLHVLPTINSRAEKC